MVKIPNKAVALASVVCQERRTEVGLVGEVGMVAQS